MQSGFYDDRATKNEPEPKAKAKDPLDAESYVVMYEHHVVAIASSRVFAQAVVSAMGHPKTRIIKGTSSVVRREGITCVATVLNAEDRE